MTNATVTVEVNGAAREIARGTSLALLLEHLTGSLRGSAVVVDDEVVPRSLWAEQVLADGQRVELITAVQGG